MNERQALRELRLHRDAVLHRLAIGQLNHLADRAVDLHAILPWRRLFDEVANPANDVTRSMASLNNISERLPRFLQIRRLAIQPAQYRLRVGGRRGNGLFHFMDNRSRELPHRCDAVRVRQLHLQLTILSLATGNLQSNGSFRSEVRD